MGRRGRQGLTAGHGPHRHQGIRLARGMHPDTERTPVPAELIKLGLVVFDAVYNPVKTRLLTDAETAGAETISGIDMLMWQGALAFELWTGAKAPIDIMKTKVVEGLTK